nr:major capsid protein [uncultured Mediterranean phage uvMED]BAR25545.1 major capsid protein [uncultured Mediterranean phage uvMED]
MTNMNNITRPNQVNGANDERATALKLFSGEVFNAFNSASIAQGLVRSYTLRGGKSKQFLMQGKLNAGYHVAGTPILGDDPLKAAEKTILMDDLLVASQFVYDLDEVLAQYSQRSEISKQIGEALALHYDERIFRVLDMASRAPSAVDGEVGGFEIEIGTGKQFDAQAIVDGFFEAAATLDERNAPADGRVAVLNPRQYYSLISSVDTNILNREIGNTQGDMNSGKGLVSIAGISIRKSNNLPFMKSYNTSPTPNGEKNDYTDSNDTCAGLIFHKEAAGVLTSIAPSIETTSGDFHVQYQGDLIVGKLAMGCGHLRTSVAGSLQAKTTA